MSEKKHQMDMSPGLVSWNELVTNDLAGSKQFYTKLFGWSFEEMGVPYGTYNFLKLGERPVGGMLQMPPEAAGAPTMWMPYVTVADLKDAVAKATSLGAKLCRDITPVPEMGSFAIITDPQGATLGLWEFAGKC